MTFMKLLHSFFSDKVYATADAHGLTAYATGLVHKHLLRGFVFSKPIKEVLKCLRSICLKTLLIDIDEIVINI